MEQNIKTMGLQFFIFLLQITLILKLKLLKEIKIALKKWLSTKMLLK